MKSSASFFNSSIGQKYVMGITGLFLIVFLIVHVFVNSLIFFDSSGELFNKGAHLMGTNWLIRAMEIILFLGIIVHIIQSLRLTRRNSTARPAGYAVENLNANSKWYSRSMGLLGTLLLMFLIVHLQNFWAKARLGLFGGIPQRVDQVEHDMYTAMLNVFSNPVLVILYVVAMISLAYHLLHGFQSAFQSMGLVHHRYTPAIKCIGRIYSILIPVLFALMPVYIYFFVK